MKTSIWAAIGAAALTSLASAPSAFAADPTPPTSTGHYEWRAQPSYGPRTPTRPPVRIWVSDGKKMAGCDCGMMHGSKSQAADCMAMPADGSSAS